MVTVCWICLVNNFLKCEFPVDYKKNYYPNLLTWKELANLINIRPLMSEKRVKLLDPQNRRYEWYTHGWMKDKNTYPPSLLRSLLDEFVVYFSDMSRATEKLNDFASNMENEYQRHTDAHIYVCRNTEIEHPFGAHFDLSHNIIVQCEGKTNFKVWKKIEDHAFERRPKLDMKEEPILDVIMEPGDAIWIPMYYPHQAISLTPRLSVSFPFGDNENAAHKQSFEDRNWITL